MKTKLVIIGLAAAIRVQADTNFFEVLICGDTTYTNATISQVTPAYATVNYSEGIAQILLRELPENLQRQYHYNSNAAAQYALEQNEKSKQDCQNNYCRHCKSQWRINIHCFPDT